MTYRQKSCKYCGATHKKRGPYCSKVCSNKDRTLSEPTKARISHSQAAAHMTHEVQEGNWERTEQFKLQRKFERADIPEEQVTNPEELYLPPMKSDQPEGSFVSGGDLWFEKD
mgnify:FL=1